MGIHTQGRYLTSEKFEGEIMQMILFVYQRTGRAYECTELQEWIIGMCHYWYSRIDDFSIINQGFAGEVDIVGVLGVLLGQRAWLAGESEGCGESYVCLVKEFTVSFVARKLANEVV